MVAASPLMVRALAIDDLAADRAKSVMLRVEGGLAVQDDFVST
jgi:hypothetical protein